MRVNDQCSACLLDKQKHRTDDPEYLAEVKWILKNRKENDTAPYLVYLFNRAYERRFGKTDPYKAIKQAYNDYVLSMEEEIRHRIESDSMPLAASFAFARIGNYIDFGAMNQVDGSTFMDLLSSAGASEADLPVLESFIRECRSANRFLLIADNCGEIVLDKLFLEQVKKHFPMLKISVLVRGEEVLNDATCEDARYVGLDSIAEIISNGSSMAGTVYEMLPEDARAAIDQADVILAKGQGNYETLSGQGRHIFYSLLCKCDLFMNRFRVPRLTGLFIEENGEHSIRKNDYTENRPCF